MKLHGTAGNATFWKYWTKSNIYILQLSYSTSHLSYSHSDCLKISGYSEIRQQTVCSMFWKRKIEWGNKILISGSNHIRPRCLCSFCLNMLNLGSKLQDALYTFSSRTIQPWCPFRKLKRKSWKHTKLGNSEQHSHIWTVCVWRYAFASPALTTLLRITLTLAFHATVSLVEGLVKVFVALWNNGMRVTFDLPYWSSKRLREFFRFPSYSSQFPQRQGSVRNLRQLAFLSLAATCKARATKHLTLDTHFLFLTSFRKLNCTSPQCFILPAISARSAEAHRDSHLDTLNTQRSTAESLAH